MKEQIAAKTFQRIADSNENAVVFRAPYCSAQMLLSTSDAYYYNKGVYGWNCDMYLLSTADHHAGKPAIWICTGYRNLTGKKIPNLAEWEERARKADWSEREAIAEEFADYLRTVAKEG